MMMVMMVMMVMVMVVKGDGYKLSLQYSFHPHLLTGMSPEETHIIQRRKIAAHKSINQFTD